jgi:hypothetical protein
MTPALAPHKGVLVLIPVHRCDLNAPVDRLPGLEASAFEGERTQHPPPGLDQVKIRCVLRLEDDPPARICQGAEQHIGGSMGLQVIDNCLDLLAVCGQPGIDMRQEVHPVDRRTPLVRLGEGFTRGRAQGAEDIAFAAPTIVGFLRGALGRAHRVLDAVARPGPAPCWEPASPGAISIQYTACRNTHRPCGPGRDLPSPNYCPCTSAPLGAAAR